jgi:DNA-binding NarL/FixJ family response regulator
MNSEHIRLLLIEDNAALTASIRDLLGAPSGAEFAIASAATLAAGADQLRASAVDLVLLDLTLPDAHGLETFRRLHQQFPAVPIIVLTALEEESIALSALREGAQDYLLKTEINRRLLVRAIRYAIERQRAEHERGQLIQRLQEALAHVKTLSGLLPICATCKRIRDEEGSWVQIELYVRARSNAEFTHGICPECETQYRTKLLSDL